MFTNLAGNSEARQQVLYELKFADIPVLEIPENKNSEVPSPYIGVLGGKKYNFSDENIPHIYDRFNFIFERAWVYYIVNGYIPLNVAQGMHKLAGSTIRVNGYAGGQEPTTENAVWIDDIDWKRLAPLKELDQYSDEFRAKILKDTTFKFVDNVEKYGRPYIGTYHIDNQDGLNLFVKVLKENGLYRIP